MDFQDACREYPTYNTIQFDESCLNGIIQNNTVKVLKEINISINLEI